MVLGVCANGGQHHHLARILAASRPILRQLHHWEAWNWAANANGWRFIWVEINIGCRCKLLSVIQKNQGLVIYFYWAMISILNMPFFWPVNAYLQSLCMMRNCALWWEWTALRFMEGFTACAQGFGKLVEISTPRILVQFAAHTLSSCSGDSYEYCLP